MMRYSPGDQLDRNKMYVGNLLTCRRCKAIVTEYYFDRPEVNVKDILCKMCKLELIPPKLELRECEGHLWNITQNRFEESFTLNQFYLCGWFLREQRTTFPLALVPRKNNATSYTLEHYGNRKCVRIPNYPFYYDGITECVTPKCRDIHI